MSPNPISSNQLIVGGVAVLAAIGVAFALAKSSSAAAPAPGGGSLAPFVGTWKGTMVPAPPQVVDMDITLIISPDGNFTTSGGLKSPTEGSVVCKSSGTVSISGDSMVVNVQKVECAPADAAPNIPLGAAAQRIKSSTKDQFILSPNPQMDLVYTRVP